MRAGVMWRALEKEKFDAQSASQKASDSQKQNKTKQNKTKQNKTKQNNKTTPQQILPV